MPIHFGAFSRGCLALLLCCLPCAACSPRPGASFGFVDGKPVYVVREADRESCLRAAEERCRGTYELLEEGPTALHSGGWATPELRRTENLYFVRVKCADF